MKTYQVPREVFEEIKVQLEGAKEELEELTRRKSWFVSLTIERIEDLLAILQQIEEESSCGSL